MEAEVYQMARSVGSAGVSTNAEVPITALGKGLCDLDRHRGGRCLDHQPISPTVQSIVVPLITGC